MSRATLTEETSMPVVDWMERVRLCVKEWLDPGFENDDMRKPLYFDPDHLERKRFLVVPFIEHWSPNLDTIFPQKALQSHQKLYATGFEIRRDIIYSASTDNYSLECLMIKFLRHCLVTSRDERFWVINTTLDYWLLAGPYELVMEACKGSLEDHFRVLTEWAERLGDDFEPGMDFIRHIYDLYQKTNSEILKGRAR